MQKRKKNTKITMQRGFENPKMLTVSFAAVLALAVIISVLSIALHTPSVDDDPPFTNPNETTASVQTGGNDPYVRKDGYYTFLFAGIDDVSMSTDVLMLVSMDTKNGAVDVVQIPRDTFVNKTVLGYKNITRVNSIFTVEYNYHRNQGVSAANARKLAMATLKETLEESLCVKIDEYILTDTSAFVEIIDALGGIYFDVPQDMYYEDPDQNLYIDLKAGYQHLDGKACEGLIRYRSGYATGDIGRVELREDFLVEAFRQVKENVGVGSMVRLIPTFFSKIKTSMSMNDMIAYTKEAYKVDSENIDVRTIGGSVIQNPKTGAWIYFCLNKAEALADINECLNVYETDIDEAIFDKNGLFTDRNNEGNAYIHEYYSS